MSQLNIIARIAPKPAFGRVAVAAICGIVEQTRAEPGCIAFKVNTSEADGVIYLYEEWCDEQAFNAHHAQPYTKEVMNAYAQWLAEEPQIVRLQPRA